jgi:hypothetical protein
MVTMNETEAWEDAIVILGQLSKLAVRVASRPATENNAPVVITSDKQGRIITVLRWQPTGWWHLRDAVDNPLDNFAHNTHPRVIANRIEAVHWDELA